MLRNRFPLTLLLLSALALPVRGESVSVVVTGGDQDAAHVPLTAQVKAPAVAKSVVLKTADGKSLPGQLAAPGLLSENQTPVLYFVLPSVKAGEKIELTAEFSSEATKAPLFAWHDTAGQYAELTYGDKPVLRYMYEPLDDSTPARRELTYKVFHHVYDPTGEFFVTKGPGGRYTHHRGLFFGFNRITYGDNKKADIWHARGAHQQHGKFLSESAGPVLGRHRLAVGWHGNQKEVFANEIRELTAYATHGGTLIEFATRLSSADGKKITLDGDPQHAGFHFRASNEVADKTNKQTYYLRPDGKDAPGKTRNWPGNKDHVNLPWNAMSFVLGDQRYTAVYLDRPENPKEARFSERDYGRFGSYFEYTLEGDKTLDLNYRVWLTEGELTGEQAEALLQAFSLPPKVEVK